MSEIIKNLEENKEEKIIKIGKALKEGKIVVFPTETVYGIGVNGLNKEAVKKLRLTKEYEHIVNSDIFAHLLDEKSDVIIKAYENAPNLQKEQIVSMIDERLARNQEVDGNVLVKIGKLCGKDFLRVDEDE